MDDPSRFETLVEIMDRLRSPDGCPWDREQTYETLRAYLIEECYEVAEALDEGDPEALREELGDLLFQIVFLSRIAKEQGRFTAADVVRGIAEKMIRRHPHVFGDATAETSGDVLRNWERIKRQEKADRGQAPGPASVLDGIPAALPALLKAQRLGTKAARVGFDWPERAPVVAKIREELAELESALDDDEPRRIDEELGDLLFSVVNLARHLAIDPEGALDRTNVRFDRRFRWIEREVQARGRQVEDLTLEELDAMWARAKRETAGGSGDHDATSKTPIRRNRS